MDSRHARFLRTTTDLSGTELLHRLLAHQSGPDLDDARLMERADWIYNHVVEVHSGFNVRACLKEGQRRVDSWNEGLHIEDKVRNPRRIKGDPDTRARVTGMMRGPEGKMQELPADRVRVFTLHHLFSDDLTGISAVQPILQTIDEPLGVRKVNRAVRKRYRAPSRLIEMPADSTDADRQAVQRQLEETPPDMDIVLPPGAKMHVLNHGNDALPVDALMRNHLTDPIFMGLGIPKIALAIPDGSNRSVS